MYTKYTAGPQLATTPHALPQPATYSTAATHRVPLLLWELMHRRHILDARAAGTQARRQVRQGTRSSTAGEPGRLSSPNQLNRSPKSWRWRWPAQAGLPGSRSAALGSPSGRRRELASLVDQDVQLPKLLLHPSHHVPAWRASSGSWACWRWVHTAHCATTASTSCCYSRVSAAGAAWRAPHLIS